MDPSLRKEQDAFKKRALALPSVEAKAKKSSAEASKSKAIKKSKPAPAKKQEFDYKASSGYSDNRFLLLQEIVTFLKEKHLEGVTEGITLSDILDEKKQMPTDRTRHWLVTEALTANPKVEVVDVETYKFKPTLNVRDKKSLLSMLMKNERRGLGGVLVDHVKESVPNYTKVMKQLGDQVMIIQGVDKKEVLFYNDRALAYNVDEDIQQLWRGVTVEGVDERKIEDYLQKHDIVAMKDLGISKVAPLKRKKAAARKPRAFKSHNDHLDNSVLVDYNKK